MEDLLFFAFAIGIIYLVLWDAERADRKLAEKIKTQEKLKQDKSISQEYGRNKTWK